MWLKRKVSAAPSMMLLSMIAVMMWSDVRGEIVSLCQSSKPNTGQPVTLVCEADSPSSTPPGPEALILTGQDGQIPATHTSVVSNRRRTSFEVSMAEPNAEFICKLFEADGVSVLEEKNIVLDVFVLPYLMSPPTVTQNDYLVPTTLTVLWQDWKSDGAGDGPVEHYVVLYRFQRDIEGDSNYNFSVTTDSNRTTSLAIADLEVDREYDFAIAVVREGIGGEGPPSNKTTTKTGCAAPTAAANLSVGRVEFNKIEVAWELPAQFTWGCRQLDNFVFLEWKLSTDQHYQWVYLPLEPRSYNLTSVAACTDYDIRIRFSNSLYNLSPESEVVSATTSLIEPPPVYSVITEYVADSLDLFVFWHEPSSKQCIEQFTVAIQPVRMEACRSDIVAPLTRVEVVPANSTGVRFGGLTPYTTYQVAVTSGNRLGNSVARMDTKTTRSTLPSQLLLLRIADVTERSVRLTWDPISCEDIHGSFFNFRFRFTNNDLGEVFLRHVAGINNAEFVESQVFPCRTYTIQIAAENNIGIGPYSESVNVTTLAEGPAHIRNPTGSAIADNPHALFVTWDPPDNIYCPIDYYQVSYELAHKYQCETVTGGERVIAANVTETSYNITGLLPYSSYWVYITAHNEVGYGFVDRAGIHITAEKAPTASPSQITLGSATTDKLYFYWAWPECNEPFRASRFLSFAYKLVNAENASDSITGETEINFLWFEERSPHTRYLFQVLIRAQAGDGPYSEPVEGWTFEDVPGPPSGLRLTNKSETTLTVVWDPPAQPNGVILHYTVKYRVQEKPYQPNFHPSGPFTVGVTLGQNDDLIGTLVLLEPGTKYQIRVAAVTSPGEGDFVSVEEFTKLKSDIKEPHQPAIDPSRSTGTSVFIYVSSSDDTYVSSYLVAVKKMSVRSKRANIEIDGVEYGTYEQNPDAYIAAEIVKQDNDGSFIVGNGRMYGSYTNAPLGRGMYSIRVGAKSETAEAASITWSPPVVAAATGIETTPQMTTDSPQPPKKTKSPPANGSNTVGIVAAVVIVVILVVAVVCGVVFYLKRYRQEAPPTMDTPMEKIEIKV